MSRFVDRGAIVAAYVGIGMAVTLAISFLLVIPIELAYVGLAVLAAMVIGYYANSRSKRTRGDWRRIVPNAVLAGAATGLALALLLVGNKALFFFADSGYPQFNRVENGAPVGPTCQPGADCVYHRYLAEPGGRATLEAAGVTDTQSFSDAYWAQQWSTARVLVLLSIGGALVGGVLFGLAGPRRPQPIPARAIAAT